MNAAGAHRPSFDERATGPQRGARDAELAADGWLRRFTGSPPRLHEVTELYETLGWEVLLDPLTAEELPDTCAGCTAAMSLFRVVYTRPGGMS